MKAAKNFTRIAALFAVLLLSAAAQAGDKPPAGADKLEPYECGNVQRLHVFGTTFLASQPDKDDFKTASEAGIKTVVNLREPGEQDWDEAARVKELGMTYVNVPFKSPVSLTDAVFDNVRALLNAKGNKPLILHCSSANRVGAIWLAHRVLDGGLTYDEALKEAKTVGLKLPAYEAKAKDYIGRQRAEK